MQSSENVNEQEKKALEKLAELVRVVKESIRSGDSAKVRRDLLRKKLKGNVNEV